MALRVGPGGLALGYLDEPRVLDASGRIVDSCLTAFNRDKNGCFGGLSPGSERPTQNWGGQGESDCLIKTKQCDCL